MEKTGSEGLFGASRQSKLGLAVVLTMLLVFAYLRWAPSYDSGSGYVTGSEFKGNLPQGAVVILKEGSSSQLDENFAKDATILQTTKLAPPSSSACFGGVPQVNDRCGIFLIITEAMKSGTTTLWYTLLQTPYFTGKATRCNYDRPYYECLVQGGAPSPGQNKLAIDKGPNGGRCESLIRKMHETVPDVKLVMLFRNPLDRLYSHWNHNLVRFYSPKGYNPTFREWVDRQLNSTSGCFDPTTGSFAKCFRWDECPAGGSFLRSAYIESLELYEEFYPKDQIYVMIAEEMYIDLETEMNKLMTWLDLPTQKFKPPPKTNTRSYAPMDNATRSYLWTNYFEKGVRRLEQRLGRPLPWSG